MKQRPSDPCRSAIHSWTVAALIPLSALLCLPELSTFQLGKAVLVGPVLAVLLIGGIRSSVSNARSVLAAILAIVLIGLTALVRSPSPGVGAWEMWLDLLFLGAVIGGAQLRTLTPVLVGIATAGAAMVVVTALEAAGAGPICPAAIANAGTMGNPNFTGAVLALAAPACLVLALGSRRWWTIAAWSGLLLSTIGATLYLGSWTGAVGAAVGLAGTGIHALARSGHRRAALAVAVLVIAVTVGALASSTVRGHLSDRLYMARVSSIAAMEKPLGGHGLGGFPRAFLDAQADVLERNPDERGRWTRALHAHAEPMHTAVERGLPGLFAWIALWATILVVAIRRRVSGLTGILAAGFALSLGEFPAHLVPVQLALGLAAGAASAGPAGARVWSRHLIWLLVIPLFLVPIWLSLSDRALTRGDPARAMKINPWNGRAAFTVALAEQDGTAPTGCYYAHLADRFLPSPASAMTLGLCATRSDDRRSGIKALRRAVRWNPRNAAAHANLAVLLLQAGQSEAARAHAVRASSLRPGDPRIQQILEVIPDSPSDE